MTRQQGTTASPRGARIEVAVRGSKAAQEPERWRYPGQLCRHRGQPHALGGHRQHWASLHRWPQSCCDAGVHAVGECMDAVLRTSDDTAASGHTRVCAGTPSWQHKLAVRVVVGKGPNQKSDVEELVGAGR
jgi:hypothetical protein